MSSTPRSSNNKGIARGGVPNAKFREKSKTCFCEREGETREGKKSKTQGVIEEQHLFSTWRARHLQKAFVAH